MKGQRDVIVYSGVIGEEGERKKEREGKGREGKGEGGSTDLT